MIHIDAHCHLANLSQIMPLELLLKQAGEKGIKAFASSALTRREVSWYQKHPRSGLVFSAGIHPNFDECDLELPDIEELAKAKRIWAIGEIGLDRNNPELDWQRTVFKQQLELAAAHQLPVVLHLVGHQSEAYQTLSRYPLPYLVHGYAGSLEAYHSLAKLNAWFTISSRVLKPDKHELLKAILHHKRYLFETDITQYYVHEHEANPLLRLIDVIETTARRSGIPEQELTETQFTNALALGMVNP